MQNKTKKFISTIIIISIFVRTFLLFSIPKQAEAQWLTVDVPVAGISAANAATGVTGLALKIKDVAKEIGKQVLMHIASRLLQDMTKSTINWINTGSFGTPLFLQNPESYFKDIAKLEIK